MDNKLKISYSILIFIIIILIVLPLIFGSLVPGTNCGLVATAPVDDPAATSWTIDDRSIAIKVTTTNAGNITEIGWWCDTASQASNFEVGLYSHNATGDKPLNILEVDRTNAKGTTAGWKKQSGLTWAVEASTTYWIAVQLDNTATTTNINRESGVAGERYSAELTESTLADPWTSIGESDNWAVAIYAVYEEEVPVDTCTCAGAGNNWEIDMSDYCNITEACDLTTGTLSFTGAGWCNCNASVDTTNMGDPGASGILYIQDSCLITID